MGRDQEVKKKSKKVKKLKKEKKKKSKRRSGEKERRVSGSGDGDANKPVRKRFVRAKFDLDDLDLESENVASRDSEEVSSGKKKLKGKRRTSNEGSLDEESSDLLEKMRKKNEKRLKRMKEIERDKLLFS